MKVFRIAAVFALLAGPAYAQSPHVNLLTDTPSKTPEEKEQDAIKEKAYKESLKKFPMRRLPIPGAPCAVKPSEGCCENRAGQAEDQDWQQRQLIAE